MNPEWKSRYEVAVVAAQEAGRIALQYFPDASAAEFANRIEWKPDDSPVTIADRQGEEFLRSELLKRFPNDGLLGEEFGHHPGSSGYRWIIDPIDGTRSFVRGIPLWATLIALEYQGEMIAGITVEPVYKNTYRALRGDGAYKNDRRIHVSSVDQLDKAMLFACDLLFFSRSNSEDKYLRLGRKTQRQRGYSDYFGFVLLAQGSGEIMVDSGVHIWDVACMQVLIEEAGGRFTDWRGKRTADSPEILATNGCLHDEALAILNEQS